VHTGSGTCQSHISGLCNPVPNELWITQSGSDFRTFNMSCILRSPVLILLYEFQLRITQFGTSNMTYELHNPVVILLWKFWLMDNTIRKSPEMTYGLRNPEFIMLLKFDLWIIQSGSQVVNHKILCYFCFAYVNLWKL